MSEIGRKYDLRIVNVAHAGDGNVHPILLFDERDKDQVARVLAAGEELLEECIRCGGSVTAEHGIGVEKLALMNRRLDPELETLFFIPSEAYSFLNSSVIKEVVRLGGDVSQLVPVPVLDAMKKKLQT